MSEIIDSFDSYRDFEASAYYTVCFDEISSLLSLVIPLEETKANMEEVLGIINLPSQELEIVFKNWNTEDAKNADFTKDFPYQHLFKSKEKKLILWLSLDSDGLSADFLYDCKDDELEQWVIATNHRLRSTLGEDRSPAFKVLSKSDGSFFTKKVKTKVFDLDMERMYNADFIEVDEIIRESLQIEKAGLILLHGTPGTGKTSYIKSLITQFEDKSFIFIQNEFVNELLDPSFVSFLLNHQNAILVIEDAEKVLTSREEANERSVVSTILQLTDGLFSDYLNIKIICTFNTSISKLDKALLRKGRMLANYQFGPLSAEKADVLPVPGVPCK
ncbi:MAG: AAA family ATPase, partial [Bacteroidota bacterium]